MYLVGIPTTGIADAIGTSAAVEHVMVCKTLYYYQCIVHLIVSFIPIQWLQEHPSPKQKELMKKVDELRKRIKSRDHKLRKQQEELDRAKHDGDVIKEKYTTAKKRMRNLLSKTEELEQEKLKLERDLKFRDDEIEVLKKSTHPERVYFIVLRQDEVAEMQKRVQSVKQELKKETEKIPPLKEEIQSLIVQLAEKSAEICHLRDVWEKTNSQIRMDREKVDMVQREVNAAIVSHDVHRTEVKVNLYYVWCHSIIVT